jgi:hypothetical protein
VNVDAQSVGIDGQEVIFKVVDPQQNCPWLFSQVVNSLLHLQLAGWVMFWQAAGAAQLVEGRVSKGSP